MPDRSADFAGSAPNAKLTLRNRLGYLRVNLFCRIEYFKYLLDPGEKTVPHIVKRQIVREYAKRFKLRCFIETGTYVGDMIAAMTNFFDELHSIELSEFYYRKALRRFAKRSHIHIYHGDSGVVLSTVLDRNESPALFWLDAHYSGGNTARGTSDSPIIQEVGMVLAHRVRDHVVLIDDARCFNGEYGYPTIDKLRELVMRHRPDLNMSVERDIIRIHPFRS